MTVSISLQFQPAAHRFRPWVPSLVSGSFLCLGLVYTFYPTLLSGLAKLQNDPGDTRFIHYLLEHSYRWLSGDPSHPKLWDPPFFFPLPNALAFSDTFLTLAPAYWLWRLVGFRPEIAFLLWMMVLCALNYVAAQALIRHGIGVRTIGADFGAFLIAFGNSASCMRMQSFPG